MEVRGGHSTAVFDRRRMFEEIVWRAERCAASKKVLSRANEFLPSRV